MDDQNQTYLCIRAVGSEFQLQPADKRSLPEVKGGSDNAWYFMTTRPLYAFRTFGSFGSYRDLQAAFSAMILVDPAVEGPI
jgi:hypothetical protein